MASSVWPDGLPKKPMHPTVSICTPTYNRRKFLPWLIQCIKEQTYPKERIEWLVYDDGSDKIYDVLEPHIKTMNIRYFSADSKQNVGVKRNKLNAEARGEIIVNMDDDDYYMTERVSHAVNTILSKKANIVGSSRNTLFFSDDQSIWEVGPYWANHATFGTMAYTKDFARKHLCDETVTYAEEVAFTNKYTEPLVQLDPLKVMLVMCHSENTFNKSKLRDNPTPAIRKTNLKLKNFVRSAKQRDFYITA